MRELSSLSEEVCFRDARGADLARHSVCVHAVPLQWRRTFQFRANSISFEPFTPVRSFEPSVHCGSSVIRRSSLPVFDSEAVPRGERMRRAALDLDDVVGGGALQQRPHAAVSRSAGCQALAPFLAATFDDRAAGACRHALEKAQPALATTIRWIIGRLHRLQSPLNRVLLEKQTGSLARDRAAVKQIWDSRRQAQGRRLAAGCQLSAVKVAPQDLWGWQGRRSQNSLG